MLLARRIQSATGPPSIKALSIASNQVLAAGCTIVRSAQWLFFRLRPQRGAPYICLWGCAAERGSAWRGAWAEFMAGFSLSTVVALMIYFSLRPEALPNQLPNQRY